MVFDIFGIVQLSMKKLLIIIVGVLFANGLSGQQTKLELLARLASSDTLLVVYLPPVVIYGLPVFKNKRDQRHWDKLVRNVKKVYPYAKMAVIKFKEYEAIL